MEPIHLNPFPQTPINTTPNLNSFFDDLEMTEKQSTGVMDVDKAPIQQPTFADLSELLATTDLSGREQIVEELWQYILNEAKRLNQTAPIDTRLFAMIHGGPEIFNTPYEGISPETSARFLVGILQLIPAGNEKDHQEMQHFLDDLKIFIEIDQKLKNAHTPKSKTKLAKEISALVSALKPGQRLLIPGGIAGVPGHFALYEIRDTTFRIYNTGLDLDKSQPQTDINFEPYAFPYHEIDQIDPLKLRSVEFHRMLIELTTRPNKNPELSFDDIVRRIRMMLLGRSVPLEFNQRSMRLKPQKAGTCGWSTLIAYSKVRLEFDYFKKIYFQIKFWAVPQLFLTFGQAHPSLSQRKLLIRSLYALAKRPSKIYGEFFRFDAKALDDCILLHVLLKKTSDWLSEFEIPHNRYRQRDVLMATETIPSSLLLFKNHTKFNQELPVNANSKSHKKDKKEHLSLPQTPTMGTFVVSMRKWTSFLFKLRESHASECITKMNILIRNLPIPSDTDLWSEMETGELEEIFKQLLCLAEIYKHSDIKNELEASKDVVNLYHLFALLDSLAVKLSKNGASDLSKFGIQLPFVNLFFTQNRVKDSPIPSHSLILSDFADHQRLKLIQNYFYLRNLNKTKILFAYPKQGGRFFVDQSIWNISADFEFIHDYLENDPSLEEKVAKRIKFHGELGRPFLLASLFISTDCAYLPLCYIKLREFHNHLIEALLNKYVNTSYRQIRDLHFTKSAFEKKFHDSRSLFVLAEGISVEQLREAISATQVRILCATDIEFYEANKRVMFDPALSLSHENLIAVYGSLTTNQGLYLKNKALPPVLASALTESTRKTAKADDSIEFSQLSRMIDIRSTDKLSLPICLKYYRDNLELLETSTHRQLLKFTLLEQDKLIDAITHSPAILSCLQQFVEAAAGYYFKDPEKIVTGLFLIDLFCSLETLKGVFPDLKINFASIPALRSLLERHIKSTAYESSTQVYGYLFSSMIKIHVHRSVFDSEDVNAILKAWIELNMYDHYQEARQKAQYYYYTIESRIMAFLKDKKQLNQTINDLALQFIPQTSVRGEWQGKYPLYTCGEWSFDILNGGFFKNNMTYSYLNPNQRDNYVIKTVFHVKPRDLFTHQDNVYTSEEKGLEISVGAYGIIQQIRKKIGDHWALHVSSLRNVEHLFYQRFGWLQEVNARSFISIENKAGEPIYRIDFQIVNQESKSSAKTIQSENNKRKAPAEEEDLGNYSTFVVTHCQTNLQLLNVMEMNDDTLNSIHPVVKKLLSIFHEPDVFFWVNPANQLIEKIELPFYKLSFSLNGGNFRCDQMNGLHIVFGDHYSPFQTFRSYIVLEGLDGKKYFIVCNDCYLLEPAKEEEPMVLSIGRVSKIKPSADTPNNYYLYPIDEDREDCEATSVEARLYLAYLYMLDGKPKMTLIHLKKCWQNEHYSKEENTQLHSIITYQENSHAYNTPEYYAISLYAAWLVAKNESWKTLEKHNADELSTLYIRYLNHISYLPELYRLKKDQELDLLKIFDQEITPSGASLLKQNKVLLLRSAYLKKGIGIAPIRPFFLQVQGHFPTIPDTMFALPALVNTNKSSKKNSRYRMETLSHNWMNDSCRNDYLYEATKAFIGKDPAIKEWYYCMLACAKEDNQYVILKMLYIWANPDKFQTFLLEKPLLNWNETNIVEVLNDFFSTIPIETFCELSQTLNNQILGIKDATKKTAEEIEQKKTRLLQPPLLATYPFSQNISKTVQENRSASMAVDPVSIKKLSSHQPRLPSLSYSNLFEEYFQCVSLKKPENTPVSQLTISRPKLIMQMIEKSPKACQIYSNAMEAIKIEQGKITEYCVRSADPHSLNQLKSTLIKHAENLVGLAHKKEKEILQLANRSPLDNAGTISLDDLQNAIAKKIDDFARKTEPITIEALILSFLQNDCFFSSLKNPYLEHHHRVHLKEELVVYLLIRSEMTKIDRIASALELLIKHRSEPSSANDQETTSSLIKKIKETMYAKHHYHPGHHPQLLAFEYLSKVIYREKQVQLLIKALESPRGNILFGLTMGQGKTQYILPSLALMMSTGNNLVFVVVPEQHLEKNHADLGLICQGSAGRKIYTFKFNRNSGSTIADWNKLYISFLENQQEKGVILTTRESLKSFFLVGIEQITNLLNAKVAIDGMPKITQLYNTLKSFCQIIEMIKAGTMIGDEIHHLLKSLFEMNFTFGSGTYLPSDRWTMSLKITELLCRLDYDFKKPFNIKLDRKVQEEWTILKEKLASMLFEENFASHLADHLHKRIIAYLNGESIDVSPLEELHAVNPELATLIVIAKEQLNSYIPYALSQEWNVFFGRSLANPTIEYAIPYVGSSTPNEGSEFHQYFVMINFTILTYMRTGLDSNQLITWLHHIKTQRAREISLNIKREDSSRTMRFEREVFHGDTSIYEANIHDKKLLNKIHQKYGKHPAIIFDYLNTTVFPSYTIHQKKISANGQLLCDYLFTKVIGLTGTPYNSETMNFDECVYDDDGVSSVLSIMMRRKNQLVTILEGTTPQDIIEEIAEYAEADPKMTALIDNGALIKGIDLIDAAKALREKLTRFKGIVVFDSKAKFTQILKQKGNSFETLNPQEISENERFTLYDQRNAFGANLSHAHSAVGGVTVDRYSALFQILQASIRMREAEHNQGLRFFLLNYLAESLQSIGQSQSELIGLDILLLGILNEAELFEKEMTAATLHKIKHIPQKKLFRTVHQRLCSETFSPSVDPEKYFGKNFIQAWNSIIVEDANDDPFKTYLEPISHEAPQRLFMQYGKSIIQGLSIFPPTVMDEMQKVISKSCQLLPPRVLARSLKDFQQEVEKQEDKNIEKESGTFGEGMEKVATEIDWQPHHFIGHIATQLKNSNGILNFSFSEGGRKEPGSLQVTSVNHHLGTLGYEHLFKNSLYFTRNFMESAELPLDFSMKWKPVDFFLEFSPTAGCQSKSSFLILSLLEAEKMKAFFDHAQPEAHPIPFQLNLRDITGKCFGCYTSPGFQEKADSTANLKKVLVQLMFLDGREYYQDTLEEALVQWMKKIKASGNLDKLPDLLFKLHKNRHAKSAIGNGNFFTLLKKVEQDE